MTKEEIRNRVVEMASGSKGIIVSIECLILTV